MQAVILAGGLGTRLGKVTKKIPKAMVPIHRVPFILLQIIYLKGEGFKKFLILTGYKSKQIEDYLGNGSGLGVEIKYSKEIKPLGTGGALINAKPKLDKRFLLCNGDTFIPIHLHQFIVSSKRKKISVLTALVGDDFIDAGYYVVSKTMLPKRLKKCSFTQDILQNRPHKVLYGGDLYDIGTKQGIKRLEKYLRSKNV